MSELEDAAEVALRVCLGLRRHETLLVLADPPLHQLARTLAQVGRTLAKEVLFVEYGQRSRNGEEPPQPVPQLMQLVEAVIAVTSRSITHTKARREATAAGARVATMPGITEDMLVRTMSADYEEIAERTRQVADKLSRAHLARVLTPAGTDVTLPISGIRAIASTGLIREPGQWGNLPSGEAYLMPEEGKTQGVVVVDGALAGIGRLQEPVRLTIVDGAVAAVEGGAQAQEFARQIEAAGPQARNVAELGVGTNPKAKVTGVILEDEKVLGTVHIAFGNNVSMGGTVDVPFHVDGILLNPTLILDEEVLLENGQPNF
ncbi:MAG: aminopeptidase [Thermoanaerobaculum sp.]|nr:aminopeptidase [Thermoanaerobaculum sp.]MDW7968616.1 aminopeptidase [Thermoanaerobaculum sp.]